MICPKCGADLVQSHGKADAPVLFVGEFPGQEEINRGVAFIGETGRILETELARYGFPPKDRLLTNLWLHDPDRGKGTKTLVTTPCFEWSVANLLETMKGRKGVLLMGNDFANIFLHTGVMKMSGLQIRSPLWDENLIVYLSPNPAVCMHGGVGEFRLALQNFRRAVYGQKDSTG